MKITKERLTQVVKEELKEVRSPGWRGQKTKTKSHPAGFEPFREPVQLSYRIRVKGHKDGGFPTMVPIHAEISYVVSKNFPPEKWGWHLYFPRIKVERQFFGNDIYRGLYVVYEAKQWLEDEGFIL